MFKLLLIKEFQRLKEIENNQFNLEWNVSRILSKTNYLFQAEAIKEHIVPKKSYTKDQEWFIYAEEADLLNVAMFNCTAKDWRDANPEQAKKGMNIRDFSSINELVVLSNLENLNSVLISNEVPKNTRFTQLIKIASSQLKILKEQNFIKSVKKLNNSTYLNEQKKSDDQK